MSPRKTRRGSWCPLVENRDEWGSLRRGDSIKIKSQTVWAGPEKSKGPALDV